MRYWLPLMFDPVEQFLDIARVADECGFEGLCLADHVVIPERFASVHPSGENPFTPTSDFPDVFTSVAAMAAVTERLRFMSYVYVLPMREPFSVAKQVGTAAALFPGRVVFGVGAGWLAEEMELLGQRPQGRGRRMDEMLEVIGDLWDDGRAQGEGEQYRFDPVAMFPVPSSPPPVCVGGRSEAALRRAARHDGWLGMNYGLDEVERLVARLGEVRAEQGDTRDDFEVFVIANAEPSPDLYSHLEGLGVTSTMVFAWDPADPGSRQLDAKRRGMEVLADRLGIGR